MSARASRLGGIVLLVVGIAELGIVGQSQAAACIWQIYEGAYLIRREFNSFHLWQMPTNVPSQALPHVPSGFTVTQMQQYFGDGMDQWSGCSNFPTDAFAAGAASVVSWADFNQLGGFMAHEFGTVGTVEQGGQYWNPNSSTLRVAMNPSSLGYQLVWSDCDNCDWMGSKMKIDMVSTFGHEYGHELGFDDVSDGSCLMGGYSFGMDRRQPAACELEGAFQIYGCVYSSTPGSITATATPGSGFVRFEWTDTNPSGGNPKYMVMRATDCRGPYSLRDSVAKSSAEDYEYVDTQVNESRPYHYYVTDSNCASAGAEPLGLPAPSTPPASPTNLTANWSGSGGVELAWSAPAGTIVGYRIWRNAGPWTWISNCENLASGTECPDLNPDVHHTATTQDTSYSDNVGSAEQASYQVSAYTFSHLNYNYSTPATVTISCGPAVVTVADPTLTVCPEGDAASLRIDANLHDLCGEALTANLPVHAVKLASSTPGIRLWRDSGSGYAPTDILPGTYMPGTRMATIEHSEISGCGTLMLDIVVNGQVVATNVAVQVRSMDQDTHATSSVDRFDAAAVYAASGQGSGSCWNVDWSPGIVEFLDFVELSAHVGDHVPRKLLTPNGGNLYSPGLVMPISWQPAAGDSARVTLTLVRTTSPTTFPIVADWQDTGTYNWTVPATIPTGSTWRVQVMHSAGYYKVDNVAFGIDQSDATFTILPNPVNDLIADAARTTAVIAWSDPVQGEGVAQAHEMRYMVNTPITNANFAQGELAPTEAPGPAGTTHCVTVNWLPSCRTYYFGMRTRSGNLWSLVSNVASASTTCSGNMLVSCDFSGLMAGGGGEGGGESASPTPFATASTPPASLDGEAARENSVLGGVPAGMAEDLYRLPIAESDLLAAPVIVLRGAGARQVEVDAVGLGAVDHPSGTEAIAGTSAVLIGVVAPIERVVDTEGTPLTEVLKPDAGPGTSVRAGDALLVQLGGDSRNVALVVESRGRALGVHDDSLGILVQRPDRSGGWVTIARIKPRRGFDRHAIACEGAGSLRLVFLKAYDLHSLGRLSVSATVTPEPLTLTEATHSRLGAVDDAVDQRGGAKTTLATGDTLAIRFVPREAASGTTRSHFLSVRGSLLAATTELASAEGTLLAMAEAPAPEFRLGAARPNPSTGSAVIAYTLASDARAELAIYDVSGRRVRTLVSADRQAGGHEELWDGRDEGGRTVPAGVYFYCLRAGDWHSERKLIVLQR